MSAKKLKFAMDARAPCEEPVRPRRAEDGLPGESPLRGARSGKVCDPSVAPTGRQS
jgi:hypothetical protein